MTSLKNKEKKERIAKVEKKERKKYIYVAINSKVT